MTDNVARNVLNGLVTTVQSANELDIDYKIESARQAMQLFSAIFWTFNDCS